jgi:hypothetical protein
VTRLIGGIVLGYVIFAFTAVVVFAIPARDPHSAADPAFMVGAIGAGIIAAIAGGYLGAAVARGSERAAGVVIAIIIAGAALISLFVQPGEGARWSQLAALLLMSPSAFLGAAIRSRRVRVR